MRVHPLAKLRPSPALIVAIVALVFATTGVADGAPRPNHGEVTLVTLSGSTSTTSPAAYVTGDPILLNGQATYMFTQAAGEAVQLIATVDAVADPATFCDVTTIVYGESGGVLLPLGARVDYFSEKGERGEGSNVGGIAAPATDRAITLKAIAFESNSCDTAVEEVDDEDTWHLTLTVSVVTLRD
jgi:hypothetical protein